MPQDVYECLRMSGDAHWMPTDCLAYLLIPEDVFGELSNFSSTYGTSTFVQKLEMGHGPSRLVLPTEHEFFSPCFLHISRLVSPINNVQPIIKSKIMSKTGANWASHIQVNGDFILTSVSFCSLLLILIRAEGSSLPCKL